MTLQERTEKAERILNAFGEHFFKHVPMDVVEAAIQKEAPDAYCLAIAISQAVGRYPGNYFPHVRAALSAHLQRLLTAEHVQAQERMGRSADELSNASNRLARTSNYLAWGAIVLAVVQIAIAVLQHA